MGGTSCDVCLIVDGEPLYSSDYEIEFGFPVSVPTSRRRRSAPAAARSAGSTPAASSRSGRRARAPTRAPPATAAAATEATITDANVVLGRLNPDYFLGGRLRLDPGAAAAALGRLGAASGAARWTSPRR